MICLKSASNFRRVFLAVRRSFRGSLRIASDLIAVSFLASFGVASRGSDRMHQHQRRGSDRVGTLAAGSIPPHLRPLWPSGRPGVGSASQVRSSRVITTRKSPAVKCDGSSVIRCFSRDRPASMANSRGRPGIVPASTI